MRIRADFSALRGIHWYEYAARFAFGGMTTAAAAIIAKKCGPEIGGLFLAFPAIFPASATLIEKHEQQRKQEAGGKGTLRGRKAAAIDAAGATLGAAGLVVFGYVNWKLLGVLSPLLTLLVATAAWLGVAVLAWRLDRAIRRRLRRRRRT